MDDGDFAGSIWKIDWNPHFHLACVSPEAKYTKDIVFALLTKERRFAVLNFNLSVNILVLHCI